MSNPTNLNFDGFVGRIGQWSFVRSNGKLFTRRRGRPSGAPSEAQMGVRDRFRLAANYATVALQDPAEVARYAPRAEARGVALRQVMMTDFLRPPEVTAIDVRDYRGAVGDPIAVLAMDDVGVESVEVTIRAADESVLEQGAATPVNGKWIYTSTTARLPGEMVTVVATAKDHPGNSGLLSVQWAMSA